MLPFSSLLRRLGLLLGILVGGLFGCENTVEPYGNRSDTYSVYGYLAENRKTQFLRVKRLDELLSDQKDSLDVTVRLTNRTDGRSEVLTDSMISFTDEGSTVATHNFWTDTPVQPKTRYKLTIEHPDGETTEATTITPASTEAIVNPERVDCSTPITVEFPPLQESRRVRLLVTFEYELVGLSEPTRFRFPRPGTVRAGRDGVVFTRFSLKMLLEERFENVDREPDCKRITSDRIPIYYTYLGPEWYGQMPKDSIRSPVESPYLERGKGFFGALWRDSTSVAYIPPSD